MSSHAYTATVTINIGDVNDNSPVFENVPYEFSVEEESTSGTVISTDVSAVDMDEGINADIKYRLEDDAEGKLRIDEVTGTVLVCITFHIYAYLCKFKTGLDIKNFCRHKFNYDNC